MEAFRISTFGTKLFDTALVSFLLHWSCPIILQLLWFPTSCQNTFFFLNRNGHTDRSSPVHISVSSDQGTQWPFWGLPSLPRYLETVLAFSCFMFLMWTSSLWSSSWDLSVSSSRNRVVTEPFGDPAESWRKREEMTIKAVVQCYHVHNWHAFL